MRQFLLLVISLNYVLCYGQQIKPSVLVKEQLTNSTFTKVNMFEFSSNKRNSLPQEIKDYSILKISKDGFNSILRNTSNNFELTIPSSERSNIEVQLVEVQFNDLVIKESTGAVVKYQGGRHFRGIVKGEEKSLVALSFFDDDVMGFISSERESGNYVLGKLEDSRDEFILYKDKELLKSKALDCATEEGVEIYEDHELENNDHSRALSECVRMYFEVDYNIYANKGSSTTQTSNYITGLYNQVATLYSNEQINTTISEIIIWTSTSPYTGTTSSAMLNQFTAYRNGFNGNIAMLLSYSASGGIAYVNTLCNTNSDYRMSFSSISSTYNTVPTYSWSVEVITHEFGHLLGSQHTHACAWNGNNTAIDGCYESEGSCPNPPIPSGGGTIMSYCHLTSAGINFNLGFGTQPGNLIRTKVTDATCLDDCPGSNPPTCTDGIQNGNETGVDCGGSCTPCNTGCSSNSGTLTLVLDNYPSETTWNIKNSAGTTLYSGGPYNVPNSTITVALCLPNACYTFNIFDSYGDGICCSYGQGSYNVVIAGTNVASGGQFTYSQTKSFCLTGGNTPSCTDGIQNGNETGVDCGGSCPACPTCSDGIKNGNETGVDCGGSCPPCTSTPTCSDGIKNGNETGIDCGGSCPACPTCTDGIKNGNETGIDCGGSCPACPTCTDGIKNGNETGIDCGGSCPACPSGGSGTQLGAYYFETGWDNWVDGGDDALRYQGNRSFEGNYSISLRDNSGTISSMTSPVYNATSFLSLEVKFHFYGYSIEAGEDFWLQYSSNGGSTWTTVNTYVNGTNFNNNTFYQSTVTINNSNYSFTNNAKFRFVCDASTNTDLVYIDAVVIKGYTSSNMPANEIAELASLQEFNSEINVYPNPVNDLLFINLSGYEGENINIKMFDMMGRIVHNQSHRENHGEYRISTDNLLNGIYLVKITEDGELINTTKVIVQK